MKDPTGSYGTNPAVRCPLFNPEMRAVLMMVTNILGEQSLQMAFIHRDNVNAWVLHLRVRFPRRRLPPKNTQTSRMLASAAQINAPVLWR